MNRLFLIDGHALIFRMYYAFLRRPMINSKGADMSVLYGFTKYILELTDKEKPTHIAVSFDPPGGTFRNEMYPEYKANRAETPQLIIDALEPLTELCHELNIKVLMVKGYEADDVIGTVARRFGKEGTDVFMVTPDKDYGQLVDKHIFQIRPGKSGEPDVLMDRNAVCEKYGIENTGQIIDVLTICGDTADNVPGVKGVGEVGASKLLKKYGSVDGIYQHLDELTPRQKTLFEESSGHIALSKELVTIKTDVPFDVELDEMSVNNNYGSKLLDLFDYYEFNSLLRYLGDIKPIGKASAKLVYETVSKDVFIEKAYANGLVSVLFDAEEQESFFSNIERLTLATGDKTSCYVVSDSANEFRTLLADSAVTKCGYDLKGLYKILKYNGLALEGRLDDIEVMHYLTNPEKSHKLETLCNSYLDLQLQIDEVKEQEVSLFDALPDLPSREREAAIVLLLDYSVREEMRKSAVTTLYEQMEEPLIKVLGDMEYEGVKVDLDSLKDFAVKLAEEVSAKESLIREMVDEPGLNISSPKQVGAVLFEKLALDPKAKKSPKGSWPTDEATLVAISDRHPVIAEILDYRAVKKLLSTYIEPFSSYVSSVTKKVHTTFNQALTATGRLSSSNPNLQNIPIRTERGKEIRKAFIPSEKDGMIVSADYSQIELRIMAHLCGDEHLIDAFRSGVDIHRATAAKIYAIDYNDVTDEQRRVAKTANFGIMYGISSFGLAQRLGTSRTEAKQIINDYFEAFPSINDFISETLAQAKEMGYVETVFGRRRYLPEINAGNATVRSLAERTAVNAPIQGTSADIIKVAMIGVAKRLREEGMKSRMVLQIHDELLFDASKDEVEKLCKIVVEEMENVLSLSIPLTVECGYGKNWLEAH